MATVIMSIGIPGSGKTTVLKKIAQQGDFEYVGPDSLRFEKYENEMEHADDKAIWVELRARVHDALTKGKTIVVDSTFHTAKRRAHFMEFAREHGATEIEGLYFDIPLEIVLARNQGRGSEGGKLASGEYIRAVYPELRDHPPMPGEGFDTLLKIDEKGIMTELKSEPESLLLQMLQATGYKLRAMSI